ncbi:unnamed protein product [Prorocentrum cordatum]|uniref:Thioesterase domain-containing protein n=1 Tax=Prorocentrum cordatum TaxID=2364126 RepID=A0ABN9XUN2_9DINO|nr:unnamed protein product [Polarella glacialis]
MANPLIDRILARYPGTARDSLTFPPESAEWDEKELELFIGSGGFVKPKRKKKAADVGPEGPRADADAGRSHAGLERPPLEPLLASPWWVNKPSPSAKVRLFCALGIGSVASTYTPWISRQTADAYPSVEVCVVEYPGHGTHYARALDSVQALAEALAEEIVRCHCGPSGDERPFALFGFSMGASVAYCVAQRLRGCAGLYLAGRGPPRDALSPKIESLERWSDQGDAEGAARVLVDDLLPVLMAPEQARSYARILQHRLSREDGRQEVLRQSRALVADSKVGMEANELPCDYQGRIQFYHSPADEIWPPRVDGLYDDFRDLWAPQTSGSFSSTELDSVSHDELGGPSSPVFRLVCEDLARLVSASRS